MKMLRHRAIEGQKARRTTSWWIMQTLAFLGIWAICPWLLAPFGLGAIRTGSYVCFAIACAVFLFDYRRSVPNSPARTSSKSSGQNGPHSSHTASEYIAVVDKMCADGGALRVGLSAGRSSVRQVADWEAAVRVFIRTELPEFGDELGVVQERAQSTPSCEAQVESTLTALSRIRDHLRWRQTERLGKSRSAMTSSETRYCVACGAPASAAWAHCNRCGALVA